MGQIQSGTRTQAWVFTVTQQEADASPDMITSIISVYDHDAYALVDLGATHSFILVPFTERHQIESQPIDGPYSGFGTQCKVLYLTLISKRPSE